MKNNRTLILSKTTFDKQEKTKLRGAFGLCLYQLALFYFCKHIEIQNARRCSLYQSTSEREGTQGCIQLYKIGKTFLIYTHTNAKNISKAKDISTTHIHNLCNNRTAYLEVRNKIAYLHKYTLLG